MIRTVKKPARTRVRKRGQNDEYSSRGSRSSRNTRYEIRADLCPFDGTGYIYSACSSSYDFPETDPFEVYPIFLRLYEMCIRDIYAGDGIGKQVDAGFQMGL